MLLLLLLIHSLVTAVDDDVVVLVLVCVVALVDIVDRFVKRASIGDSVEDALVINVAEK